MPAEFKAVVAGLFELARGKNTPPPSGGAAESAAAQHIATHEPSSQPTLALGEGEGSARKGESSEPALPSPDESTADSPPVATGVDQTMRSPGATHDDGGGGGGSGTPDVDEEEVSRGKVVEAPPDWVADPKVFVERILQWAQEGSAKRSRSVGAKPPKRVFPL